VTFGEAMGEAARYARVRRGSWHGNYYWAVCLETGVLSEYRGGVYLREAEVSREDIEASDWAVCAAIQSESYTDIIEAA